MKSVFLLIGLLALVSIPRYHCESLDEGDDDNNDVSIEEEEEEDNVEKIPYKPPTLEGNVYLAEPFNSKDDLKTRWTVSQAKKDDTDENIAKYDGRWSVEEPKDNAMEGDLALLLKTKAKHHAISSKLEKTYVFSGKPFIVQYEVKFQNGIDCGGAYVKLLSENKRMDLKMFQDKTPYTIMFGPDKCGMEHKLHFIFRHKNLVTGEFEEKHAKKPTANIDKHFTDKKTHMYTLVVNPDNTFEMMVDNILVNEGSLLDDVSPPVNPPKEIDDPNDKKPSDWDDREKIQDPEASKPEDWDEAEPEKIVDEDAAMPSGWLEEETELIPDPEAEKPSDWDDDMDGDWEAPLINNPLCQNAPGCGKWEKPSVKNPKYKGKWSAPIIDNPGYQGVWKPKRIDNPSYFEDLEPYKMTSIGAVGLELWSMNDDIVFDNFLITDDKSVAEQWAAQTWEIKSAQEKAKSSGRSVVDAVLDATKDRPWLWAVILIVVVLPIVLIIAYCCMSKSEPEKIQGHKKKTDEASPDEAEEKAEEEGEKEEEGEDVGPGGDNPTVTKKSKADLEADETNDADEEDEEETEEAEDKSKNVDSPRRSSPRKRKPRKD
ncbi:calnexin-like isoform X2 [Mizuhopecten yessoensis]|uniref:Calnexin n=1 Tax=Mizuhopecten yessoensis TaxID=6573 RepID=A0A210QC09_MIZYE|nr:calnexin-like isoform X2 [Mizuhopecten yessoensis]OWF46265.1 Calnexin [Mizuhopecten yessoensis]